LNPTDPDADDREWIARVWLNISRRAMGLPGNAIGFESHPAVGQLAISSPPLLSPFAAMNRRKRYRNQVKPFNFLSTCHVRPFGHPYGSASEHFQLIAPYERDSRRWLTMPWIDRYSTKTYQISTAGDHGDRKAARVKTYGEVIEEYAYHSESKCADANGQPSDKQTIGLLHRRHADRFNHTNRERIEQPGGSAGWTGSRRAECLHGPETRLLVDQGGPSVKKDLVDDMGKREREVAAHPD
jgi:hypothetical protein